MSAGLSEDVWLRPRYADDEGLSFDMLEMTCLKLEQLKRLLLQFVRFTPFVLD